MPENFRMRGVGLWVRFSPDEPPPGGPDAPPQNMAALAKAQEVRIRRAEIKREIEAGAMAHCYIADPAMENAFLRELLMAIPRWGVLKVNRVMQAIGAFNPRCGDLTDEQIAIISYYVTWPKGKRFVSHPRARNRLSSRNL